MAHGDEGSTNNANERTHSTTLEDHKAENLDGLGITKEIGVGIVNIGSMASAIYELIKGENRSHMSSVTIKIFSIIHKVYKFIKAAWDIT
jgi:hypothetical protein